MVTCHICGSILDDEEQDIELREPVVCWYCYERVCEIIREIQRLCSEVED